MANPLYNNGDYYIGVDGKTYYYQNGKWQQWLFEGAPVGGKLAIPPTGAAAIASGAFVPAAGQEETIKLQAAKANEDKYSATATAGNPNGALRYPEDPPIASDSDYVVFDFYKYTPPFKTDAGSEAFGVKGYDQYNAISYEKTDLKTILLYMPEDISTGYKSNWTGKNFSNIGAGALRTAAAGSLGQTLAQAGQTINEAADRFSAIASAQVISAAIGKITGESVGLDDVFGSTRGVILNPNTELLFTGLDLRNFSLTYKLVPRSAKEATTIENIITTFKNAVFHI